MKNLEKLGKALNKVEQRTINGGIGNRCVPVDNWCSPQTKANGRLIDSNGNFIRCCFLAVSIDTPIGPCSHPC